MIHLTHQGVEAEIDHVAHARTEFRERHYTMLPGFLDPRLLKYLMRHVAAARLVVKSEVDAKDHEFGRTLFVPLNEPAWFIFSILRYPHSLSSSRASCRSA